MAHYIVREAKDRIVRHGHGALGISPGWSETLGSNASLAYCTTISF